MDSTRGNLLLVMTHVVQRAETGRRVLRLVLYGLILYPIGYAVLSSHFGTGDSPVLLLACFTFSLLICTLAFIELERSLTRRLLAQSDLAMRIASGDFIDDPIYDAAPWPWRMFLPGGSAPTSLPGLMTRVAWNLDWYLTRRSTLWRWQWVLQPLALLVCALALMNLGLSVAVLQDLSERQSLLLAYMMVLPIPFLYYRRQIWMEELARHLRERLQA